MTTTNVAANSELTSALTEIQEAQSAMDSAEHATETGSAEPSAAEIAQFRDRARKQRERGVKNLERRYSGVISAMRDVQLNERVVGSAFQRFFPTMENGLYVIQRRGAMTLGEKGAQMVLSEIDQRVAHILASTEKELSILKQRVAIGSQGTTWMTPEYIQPAAAHQVQIRTPRAIKMVEIFEKKDELVSGMQSLVWNFEMETVEVEKAELLLKQELRDIFNFIRRTLRGMETQAGAQTVTANDKAAA